jgi:hypothetical protein
MSENVKNDQKCVQGGVIISKIEESKQFTEINL